VKASPRIAIRSWRLPSGQTNHVVINRAVTDATPVPTARTSFSCWRSIPWALRSLTTIEAAPSAMPAATSTHPAVSAAVIASRVPAMPSGFVTRENGSSRAPARMAFGTASRTRPTASTAAAGRQLGEGSRPSGNSSSAKANSGAIGSDGNHAASRAPGSGSDAACSE
jgi:hypothetical protein